MAKIHEEVIVIKLSKLVRESDPATTVATDDHCRGIVYSS
jgi:hypothetical protein